MGSVVSDFPFLFMLFSGVYGSIFASFFCVVFERRKTKTTIMGRSHCVCGRTLKITENIPIIGFLKTKGVSKCCESKIPSWYFFAELTAFALWFVLGILGFAGMLIAFLISVIVLGVALLVSK